MIRRIAAALSAAALVGLGLTATAPAAQADSVCSNFSSTSSTCVNSTATIGGASYSVDWYLPHGTASALMVLNHGFSRDCANLRGTSKSVVEKGVMVLCVNADMTGGNPDLGNALGEALAGRTLTPPAGKALPVTYIAGGHSAGGHFASVVGARLASLGYPALAGAILFDPVANGGFTANLEAISAGGTRPVLSVAARPNVANLFNNSFGALTGLANSFVGVQLVWEKISFGIPIGGSCHIDVEGSDSDIIGIAGAGCSANATQTSRLRDFGATWARDLATGTRTSAYWCNDASVLSTCGSKIRDLVDRTLPVAANIPVA